MGNAYLENLSSNRLHTCELFRAEGSAVSSLVRFGPNDFTTDKPGGMITKFSSFTLHQWLFIKNSPHTHNKKFEEDKDSF